MLDNIRDHSIVVANIVRVISRGLINSGVQISEEKAVAGALLHDIGKTPSLRSGGDHAAMGGEICKEHSFDEIADVVGEHVRLKEYHPDENCSEKEIVYYADKRVLHSSVVSLEVRLRDILERYGGNDRRIRRLIRENFAVSERVERKIFSKLDFKPEDLPDLI
jgi:putative nucleotidyltransferase with HDIG domain